MSKNLAENGIIRFISVSKKKQGLFANFKVEGLRAGVSYSATIAVDVEAMEIDMSDPLEEIIEACAVEAVKQIQKTEFQFQGMQGV